MQSALERKSAVGDQVVAGISAPTDHGRFDVVSRRRGTGHRRGLPGDLDLGQARTSRQLFYGVPVAISSREVHVPEGTSRAKDLIDQADAFDELGPVEPRDEAHARDHVSDRHVHRRLALVLDADHLLGVGPLGSEKPLLPAEDGGDRRVLIAQALEELDASRRRQRLGREPTQGGRRDLRAVWAEAEKAVGEVVRLLPRCPAEHNLLRDAAEVVDEEDPEADRDRPQLADGQRLDALVGPYHAPQALRFEAAIRVRDVGPGETHNPRVAREMALGQLGELAVVVRGQVVADLAELLVDDVKVVDQPFRGRRDRPFVLDRTGQDAIRLQQDAAVLGDTRSDGVSPTRRVGDHLGGGESPRMLLQPLDAEELGKDRLFRFGLRMHPSPTAPRRVSEGLVRTHLSLSAHGDAARDVPVLASIAARRGALPFSARTPEPSSPARIQPQ